MLENFAAELEVLAITADDRCPFLARTALIEVSKAKGTDDAIHITRGITKDDTHGLLS